MTTEKKELRKDLLEKRRNLPWQDVQIKSHQINEILFSLPAFNCAHYIFVFLPIKKEPNSLPIIKNAWNQGKKILVPVTLPEKKSLLASRLEGIKELTKGCYGIPEPKQNYIRPVDPLLVDLCLLPGIAFAPDGFRLGYGGGYFDRFLPHLRPNCPKIALAYDFQLVEALEHDEHDIPVDMIITESTIINCQHD